MNLETLVPSKANDKQFINWLANYFRSGASPTATLKLTKTNTEVNIIDILSYIKVPTLLMQRTNDIDVKIEEGKFISERIKDSKFVEFDGNDHLFWVGNTREVLDEMKTFITELKPDNESEKGLTTILFGEIVSSQQLSLKGKMINDFVNQSGGVIIRSDKKIFMAAFEVPGKAVQCSLDLKNSLQDEKTSFSMGMYIKESYRHYEEPLNKRDEYIITSIRTQLHQKNQILVTQTIKYLLLGSTFNFIEDTSILDYASHDLCKLYNTSKKIDPNQKNAGD